MILVKQAISFEPAFQQPRYQPTYEDAAVFLGSVAHLALYIFNVQYLWNNRKTRSNLILLAYMTILLSVESGFIVSRDSLAFYGAVFVLTFLADLFVLRQCWIISNESPFPAVLVLLVTALGTYCAFGSFSAVSLILTVVVSCRVLVYRILPPENVKHYLTLLILTLFLESIALYSIFSLVVLQKSFGRANEVWVGLATFCQHLASYMFVHCLGMGISTY
ncbi:hypothetical protein C8J56DRAFT_1163653 [Mycena floridula]|nr:hypothetical protein C8J56DRAFT_1163653 [Mycena floridula]